DGQPWRARRAHGGRRARAVGGDAVPERVRHPRGVRREGAARAARGGGGRRGDRRRQRQHRRLGGDRRAAGRPRGSRARQGVRERADGRNRRGARPLRAHGRRRRQLRLRRPAPLRRPAARGRGAGAGVPAAVRRRPRDAGGDAVPAPVVGEPDVLRPRAPLVPRAHPRRELRAPRVHEGALRAPRPAVHRDGVRHGDGHQGQPLRGPHRRDTDHALPRRPEVAPAAPPDVPRRLAHAPLLPAVQPALALPGARARARRARPDRLRARDAPAHHPRRRLRRAHAALRQPRDPRRGAGGGVRGAHQDVRDQRGAPPARPAHQSPRRGRHARARAAHERARRAARPRPARRRGARLARGGLRRARLRGDDARGDPRRDALGARRAGDARRVLQQRARAAPPV
ncbi:MAG: dolichol-p-glucose synthetase, (glycosyltransferase), partial [uncultured Solirubrobacteraceae bacterium]